MKVKIYYHQTDCGGVVYYANYLHFLEEARTEFLAQRGVNIKELIAQGAFFVVSHQELDYKAPAGYGDILDICTQVKEVSGVRIKLEHKIKKIDGTLVVQAETTLAFVNRDFRPKPIPQEMRARIEKA
jgi:acyl-CoA thioester hydrolase